MIMQIVALTLLERQQRIALAHGGPIASEPCILNDGIPAGTFAVDMDAVNSVAAQLRLPKLNHLLLNFASLESMPPDVAGQISHLPQLLDSENLIYYPYITIGVDPKNLDPAAASFRLLHEIRHAAQLRDPTYLFKEGMRHRTAGMLGWTMMASTMVEHGSVGFGIAAAIAGGITAVSRSSYAPICESIEWQADRFARKQMARGIVPISLAND